jgi:hypothetical protein
MEDCQKTPRGHPNFNSYAKNLGILVFWTDGQTERQRNQSGVSFVTYWFIQVNFRPTWATYSSYVGQVHITVRDKVRVNTKKKKISTY